VRLRKVQLRPAVVAADAEDLQNIGAKADAVRWLNAAFIVLIVTSEIPQKGESYENFKKP
jgi:hypothetical protein